MRSTRELVALALGICAALVPRVVRAQPVDPAMPSPPPEPIEQGGIARPGQESGRLDDYQGEDSDARQAARGLLFFPKLAFGVALTPVRGTVYLGDRYSVAERARRWFFNEEETIGAFPVVGWDSGFGPNAGIQFVARDKLGSKEAFTGKAVIGWASRATVLGRLTTGELLGEHVTLGLEALYDRNPAERFYGFGNGNEIEPRDDGMLINPNVDNRAVETRFFERQARLAFVANVRPIRAFHIQPGISIASVETSDDISARLNEPPLGDVYNVMDITGFPQYKIGYGELELRFDTRRRWDKWESKGMPSKGWLISAFAGRAIVDVGEDYFRYGADLQKLFHLGMGPRSLALRFHGEGVTGDTETVPFTELPTLGGPMFLRGYNLDRFRDRIAAVAGVEYAFDLSEGTGAHLFVDAGRVYSALDELTLDDMRVGFGVGIQAHTASDFLARVQLASSIDGGVFLNLVFEPAFEPQMRVRTR